ncbi:SMP-30/gluconolactonase/LRE family protein [Rhizobiaceae sp. 2RAB30]
MTGATVAFASRAILGECPVWSPARGKLLWVDTFAPALNLFDPVTGDNVELRMPGPLGFVAENRAGELAVGIGCNVAKVDEAGTTYAIAAAPHAQAGFRLNDARFDAQDRLWVGLIDETLSEGSGRLYRLDPDGTWHQFDNGFALINGLDWSRDGRTMYVTDSRMGTIYAYDFDCVSGGIGNRRPIIRIPFELGKPDGLTVDPDGFLLSVLFDGSAIARISPAGSVDRLIGLPVPRPTSCAFGGDGRSLFVTSARLGLTDVEIEAKPMSGALLRLEYEAVLR